jgi:hypothetical protein
MILGNKHADHCLRLRSALENLRFCTGEVYRAAPNVAKTLVRELWESGELPYKVDKQWVVGYSCDLSFYSFSIRPICVGPAKPSKFRDRHVTMKIHKINFKL